MYKCKHYFNGPLYFHIWERDISFYNNVLCITLHYFPNFFSDFTMTITEEDAQDFLDCKISLSDVAIKSKSIFLVKSEIGSHVKITVNEALLIIKDLQSDLDHFKKRI